MHPDETHAMPPATTDQLAAAFCDRTLPKAEWTHEAHLRVGLWHLLRYSPEEAMNRLRDGIRAYNVASGVANTDQGGYHETITGFYVWQIGRFLAESDRATPIDDLARQLIARYGDRELPLRYYTRELLRSVESRRQWVEPDLRALEGARPCAVSELDDVSESTQ